MYTHNRTRTAKMMLATILLLLASLAIAYAAQEATPPKEIAADAACGKCGMFPARYPQWQTQIIFADGAMVPFDGCKCMFGFMFNMEKYDKNHTPAAINVVWVKDFNSGAWINGKDAHYVIGSDAMGPMGKELIPFSDAAGAEAFQKEHGGDIASFDAITMETLKPLMGKMHMKQTKVMNGQKNM